MDARFLTVNNISIVFTGGERRRLQMLSVFSQKPNFLIMDEPSVDCDLDTLAALETYLQEFEGVLLLVSHDRAFADKVTDHLFIFEGDGEIKDFTGSLSEYASTLVELETEKITGKSSSSSVDSVDKQAIYKEDKVKRNEQRNTLRRAKKDMDNLEKQIDKLKAETVKLQAQIDSSEGEGWSVLAELTEKLITLTDQIEEKELKWLELAEELESLDTEG
jgi:ATP-binding cassette subfamily F protein uup